MSALTWQGSYDVRVEQVLDPRIERAPHAHESFRDDEEGAFKVLLEP